MNDKNITLNVNEDNKTEFFNEFCFYDVVEHELEDRISKEGSRTGKVYC
jgi:hypothetical protein